MTCVAIVTAIWSDIRMFHCVPVINKRSFLEYCIKVEINTAIFVCIFFLKQQ